MVAHLGLGITDHPGGFIAVHYRHLHIHEHYVIGDHLKGFERLFAVTHGIGTVARVKFTSQTNVPHGTQIDFLCTNVNALDENGTSFPLEAEDLTVSIANGVMVWPGDTDDDNLVDQADVLPIGTYYGQTGQSRTDASIFWTAQNIMPWTQGEATYADADGNGTVNEADVLPIGFNWGRTHTEWDLLPDEMESTQCVGKVQTGRLKLVTDVIPNPGDDFWIEVQAEGVNGLFGIAFTLDSQPEGIFRPKEVVVGEGMGDDLIVFSHIDGPEGRISIGISRKADQDGVDGPILIMKIKMGMSADVTENIAPIYTLNDVTACDASGNPIVMETSSEALATRDENESSDIPTEFVLFQNYPNPFNPETTIRYTIPSSTQSQTVRLEIYNTLGEKIRTLVNGPQRPGVYSIRWDTRDDDGVSVAGGVYLYRLSMSPYTEVRKMLLLR